MAPTPDSSTSSAATAAVTLRYFAAARAAAGHPDEVVHASTIADALTAAGTDKPQRFRDVIAISSLLVDGAPANVDAVHRPLTGAVTVDVLPPFAGG